MHNVIGEIPTYSRGGIKDPILEKLLSKQYTSINKVIREYYRPYGPAVNSSHPLIRLIYSFTFSADSDVVDVFSKVTDRADEYASDIHLSTGSNYGVPLECVFYPECVEYVASVRNMSIADALDLDESNWVDLKPVTVLQHPYLLPLHHLPKGGGRPMRYSVLTVDIPMLASMWVMWSKANQKLPSEDRQNVEQFVGRYVLPNMLYDQQNITLLNRARVAVSLGEHIDLPSTPPIAATNYDAQITSAVSGLTTKVIAKAYPLAGALKQLPTLTPGVSMADTLPNMNAADTQANYHVRFIAWLSYVELAVFLCIDHKNLRAYEARLKAVRRLLRSRGVLRKLSNSYVRDIVGSQYDLIDVMLGR